MHREHRDVCAPVPAVSATHHVLETWLVIGGMRRVCINDTCVEWCGAWRGSSIIATYVSAKALCVIIPGTYVS